MSHNYYSSADLRREKETASRTRQYYEFAGSVYVVLLEGHQNHRPLFGSRQIWQGVWSSQMHVHAYDDDTNHKAGAASIVMACVVQEMADVLDELDFQTS